MSFSRCWSKPSGRAAEQELGTTDMGEPGIALNSGGEGDMGQSISNIFFLF